VQRLTKGAVQFGIVLFCGGRLRPLITRIPVEQIRTAKVAAVIAPTGQFDAAWDACSGEAKVVGKGRPGETPVAVSGAVGYRVD
jgi:hypothetical protein